MGNFPLLCFCVSSHEKSNKNGREVREGQIYCRRLAAIFARSVLVRLPIRDILSLKLGNWIFQAANYSEQNFLIFVMSAFSSRGFHSHIDTSRMTRCSMHLRCLRSVPVLVIPWWVVTHIFSWHYLFLFMHFFKPSSNAGNSSPCFRTRYGHADSQVRHNRASLLCIYHSGIYQRRFSNQPAWAPYPTLGFEMGPLGSR